jgi:hypothetical protein
MLQGFSDANKLGAGETRAAAGNSQFFLQLF